MTSVRLGFIVAVAVLALCAASPVGALADDHGASSGRAAAVAPATGQPAAAGSADADTARPAPLDDGVTVYYFHRTIRCETCLKAEALADSLIATTFADEIATDRLAWVVVNVEEAGNEGFVDRYELGPFGLVLSFRSGGEEVLWRELESVEDLAAYPGLFNEYLSGELRHALATHAGEFAESRDTTKEDHREDAR